MKTYIIQKEDVGKTEHSSIKTACWHCGQSTSDYPFAPLGRVLSQDVGKMCKKVNGVWYVENEQQFKERTAQ